MRPDLFGHVRHRPPVLFYGESDRCTLLYEQGSTAIASLLHDVDVLGWESKDLSIEAVQDGYSRVWIEIRGPSGCTWCQSGTKGQAAATAKRLVELQRKEARRRKRAARKPR